MPSAADTLLPPEEALEQILRLVTPLPAEWTSVERGLGRTLATPVLAQRTHPPWDNSAMDGYAVRSADIAHPPARLKVIETIYAGQVAEGKLGPMECARIMTGAPLPPGADAVVMQEKTRRPASGSEVEILASVEPGNCIRARGEDAREGEALLERGSPLGIPEAALLWAQGITQISVPRRPRVSLITTGDELCRVDQTPDGRIIDTNSLSLSALVERAGGLPVALGIARDSLDETVSALQSSSGSDAVILNAGASVGERDYVLQALEQLGVEISFWKVAIKPGKPLAVGRSGSTVFFALPGNPTSSLVCFELFVRPAIRRFLGHREVAPPLVPGRSEVVLDKAQGLTHYVRVVTRWADGQLWAKPLASQTSGALRSASQATHLLLFPAKETHLASGSPVALIPLSWVA